MWTRVIARDLFSERLDARPVAYVRILVGAGCIVSGLEAWRILERVLAPENLRLAYVTWAVAPSHNFLLAYIVAWVAAAAAFAIGWHTRIAGSVLCALMAYVLVIDQQTYSNHLYLLSLIVLLLTIADSGRAVSVDARGHGASTIAAWPVTLLKLQVSIVYVFAALSKINVLYLSGVIIYLNLQPSLKALVGGYAGTPTVMMILAVLSVLVELWLAIALWSPNWRSLAVSVAIAFHIGLVLSLTWDLSVQLTVFTIGMMSLYVLFFDHVPHRLTVYFDSSCGVCTWVIRWFVSQDKQQVITTISAADHVAFRHDTSGFDLAKSVLVIDEETGEHLTQSRAFAAMVKALPPAYQPLRVLVLPGFVLVSDAAYRLIARYRHRISEAFGLDYCVALPARSPAGERFSDRL
jgi:predicted DCC family thiol-disulfide oxidoreductase YuxK